jgi:hypothetical protein
VTEATVLAYHPIPLALALNTIFFGAVWWAIFFAGSLGRRALRVRAGRCLRCGYDLTGNTSGICPECGAQAAPAGHSEPLTSTSAAGCDVPSPLGGRADGGPW